MITPSPLPNLPTAHIGAHSLSVIVDGDPVALRVVAAWMSALAGAEHTLSDDLTTTVNDSHRTWRGPASDNFRETTTRYRDHAERLGKAAAGVSSVIETFANEIRAVKNHMATAKESARTSGYRVTRDTIEFPVPLLDPAATGPSAAVTAMVQLARGREAAAHEALRAGLSKHKSFVDSLPTWTRAASLSKTLFTTAAGSEKFMKMARSDAEEITQAAQILRDGPAERVQLPADPKQAAIGKAWLKPFAFSSGAIAVAGVGYDLYSGVPADKALVKGGASFATGAAVSAGLETLAVVAFGASPPGLLILGIAVVSMVVSAGVGHAIDEAWHTPAPAPDH